LPASVALPLISKAISGEPVDFRKQDRTNSWQALIYFDPAPTALGKLRSGKNPEIQPNRDKLQLHTTCILN
jgi:hypothetical protein